MAKLGGTDEHKSLQTELAEVGKSSRLFQSHNSSLRNVSLGSSRNAVDDELIQEWAKIERLPTYQRSRVFLFDEFDGEGVVDVKGKRVIDASMLEPLDHHLFIEKLIKQIEQDNLCLLQKIRKRIDKVGLKLPAVEVRYKNLCLEAECTVVDGKPLPTLWNSIKGGTSVSTGSVAEVISKLLGYHGDVAEISILKDVNGVIKPGRMTLLLGPPGCGKTSLLLALSGNLDKSLKIKGDVEYNGFKLNEFIPQKTSAYISQQDLSIPQLTVRETIDFSACCQGVGKRAETMIELCRREKQGGIIPDPDIDSYMKAISVGGSKSSLQTDYILKILGLNVCADTIVGNAMRRGISGGQKKRLTTGEMIVGPTKALFMDEITNGLDSSTGFQIVSCIRQLVHIMDATSLIALLQPSPEIFDLFDDVILMAEGKIVYHGPCDYVLQFFEDCGFRCPVQKGVADFLQEVISRKDQQQYWCHTEPYNYVSPDIFHERFRTSSVGVILYEELSHPHTKTLGDEDAICFSKFSLPKWELFKICLSRKLLLMKRNYFVYVFKLFQLIIMALITMTAFIRTRMRIDNIHANYYLGALFYVLILLVVDGMPEVSMTVIRLPTFFKQRDLLFYPAWAYAIPSTILKVPLSFLCAFIWTTLTYYTMGFSPEVGRFLRQLLLLSGVHIMAISSFRFSAVLFQTTAAALTAANVLILLLFTFSGFIIPKPSMPGWLKWGFWVSPLSYGEIGLAVNEFLAPRWQKIQPSNTTLGQELLQSRGLQFDDQFYWISVGALFGSSILCSIGYILAFSFFKAPRTASIVSREKLSQLQGLGDRGEDTNNTTNSKSSSHRSDAVPSKGNVVLPFQPLTLTFHNVQYYIDTPSEMREGGFTEKKLHLLNGITGAFRPGVLTALMGVSGAGKTTLLDVLAGRKTSGTIEGEIRIEGYPKVQDTFVRISGYCEQTDIHSTQITVEESLVFSASLRLPDSVDSKTRTEFVKDVLETIELDEVKDALVGMPGVSGLSTEQRKRLTIAVELVANPSIIFMDEPTTGLDARAAAIVMRAVNNVVATGRTVVCTIHQPSMDIFEAFDELILLKSGGQMIYSGPLGQQSSKVIEYFQNIPGVPKILDNYNPATWILDVTSASAEIGIDFAEFYRNSVEYKNNEELVQRLSTPSPGSKDLHFDSCFSRSIWDQYKSCLWKQHLSYWRSPSYNLRRLMFAIITSLILSLLFWKQGMRIESQQSLFTIFGSMFIAVVFLGIDCCLSVVPYIATEKAVVYRERFAGMYSSWAYSFAQVSVEFPYLFSESLIFTLITYPMIGYYWSAYKVFWYLYGILCALLYYNFLGMMIVSLTPNQQLATIMTSAFNQIFNLFGGFLIPQPQIPKWWVWLYYICPTSWTLNGLLSSQYGDIYQEITVFEKRTTVASFIEDYFGFHHNHLGVVAVVLLLYPLMFASLFAYFIGKLNFQRR